MPNTIQRNDLAVLTDTWTWWTHVVATVIDHQDANSYIDRSAYAESHQLLLATCRQISSSEDHPARGACEQIEAVARPWVTFDSLAHADREILRQVLVDAQLATKQLDGSLRRGPVPWRTALRLGLFVVAMLLVAALTTAWLNLDQTQNGSAFIPRLAREAWLTVRYSSLADRLIALCAATTLITAVSAWRVRGGL